MPRHATLAALLSCLALTACGGGGGGSPSTSASTSSSGSTVTATGLYTRQPDIAACDPGQLADSERTNLLNALNSLRALHRLPALTYDALSNDDVARSALLGVANATLTPTPAKSLLCYSDAGYRGSSQSDLYLFVGSGVAAPGTVDALASLIRDEGQDSLGHRRTLLDPFLSQTALGRVDGKPLTGSNAELAAAVSIKVIGYPDANLSQTSIDYVAVPEGDYPARYFNRNSQLSFTVLADRSSPYNNGASQVNLSAATVSVSDANGNPVAISGLSAEYSNYGVPNVLRWRLPTLATGTRYTVQISGIKVGGVSRNTQYSFRVQ